MKQIQKGLFIFLLYFFQHFLALRIEVPPDIELLLLALLLFLLFLHGGHVLFCLVEAEYIIEISLVDIDVLALGLRLLFLEQFDVDLHALSDAVVSDRPPAGDAVAQFSFFYSDDEVASWLAHSLLEVL